MASFKIIGKIHDAGEIVKVSDRFQKREFVIITEEMGGTMVFTEYIKFQLTQDRVTLMDSMANGDMIEVTFDIKGNRWEKEGKVSYFTNLNAWKVEKVTPETAAAPAASQQTPPEFPEVPPGDAPPVSTNQQDIDDLPF